MYLTRAFFMYNVVIFYFYGEHLMSDTIEKSVSELDILKQQADTLGIKYSPNIGVETLKNKISAVIEAPAEEKTETQKVDARQELWNDAMRLVRLEIHNVNPAKSSLKGEFYTVANKIIGKVTKFVPYGDAGKSYHVPNCIYQLLEEKKYLAFRDDSSAPNGKKTELIPEFNNKVLTPLTQEELEELKKAQLAGNHID
jgi:hypothetical protein